MMSSSVTGFWSAWLVHTHSDMHCIVDVLVCLLSMELLYMQSAGKCLPFLPSHMLHTSATTTAKFLESYDQVNDLIWCPL